MYIIEVMSYKLWVISYKLWVISGCCEGFAFFAGTLTIITELTAQLIMCVCLKQGYALEVMNYCLSTYNS